MLKAEQIRKHVKSGADWKTCLRWSRLENMLKAEQIRKHIKSEAVPEIIDPVFAKTSLKRLFSMTEYERFGLVFAKSGSLISGTGLF